MKKLVLGAIVLASGATILAQGTVIFNNRSGSGTSHVWSPYGELIGTHGTGGQFGAATTFAQLLGAPGSNAPESSLLPGLPTTTFRTGVASGNVVPVTATFSNIPPDALFGSFEMVVWDNLSGLYPTWAQASVAWSAGLIAANKSAEFTIQNIGGMVNPPPDLFPGLTDIHILWPEPTTPALILLGTTIYMIFRHRK